MRVLHDGPAEDPLKDIGERPTDPKMAVAVSARPESTDEARPAGEAKAPEAAPAEAKAAAAEPAPVPATTTGGDGVTAPDGGAGDGEPGAPTEIGTADTGRVHGSKDEGAT